MLRPLFSDFCLTNFSPTSTFYTVGLEFSSAVPLIFSEGDPKPTRRNTEQWWEKGRSWLGIRQKMIDCRMTLGSPLLRPCYTRDN